MKYTEKCPQCGYEHAEHYTSYMEHTLMEESWDCPACDYHYEYCAGAHRETICFQWGFRDTPRNRAIVNALGASKRLLRDAEGLSDDEAEQ
jgi:rubredoxin